MNTTYDKILSYEDISYFKSGYAYIVINDVESYNIFKEPASLMQMKNEHDLPRHVKIISIKGLFSALSNRFSNMVNLETFIVEDENKINSEKEIFDSYFKDIFAERGNVDYSKVNFICTKGCRIEYVDSIWNLMSDNLVCSMFNYSDSREAYEYITSYSYLLVTGNYNLIDNISHREKLFTSGQNEMYYYNSIMNIFSLCKKQNYELSKFFTEIQIDHIKGYFGSSNLVKYSNRKLANIYVPDEFKEVIYNNLIKNIDLCDVSSISSGSILMLDFLRRNRFSVLQSLKDIIDNIKNKKYLSLLLKDVLLHDNLFIEERKEIDRVALEYLNNNVSLFNRIKLFIPSMYSFKSDPNIKEKYSKLFNELKITEFDIMDSFNKTTSKLLQLYFHAVTFESKVNPLFCIINEMSDKDFNNTKYIISYLLSTTTNAVTRSTANHKDLLFIYDENRREEIYAILLGIWYDLGSSGTKERLENYIKDHNFRFNLYFKFDETSLKYAKPLGRIFIKSQI